MSTILILIIATLLVRYVFWSSPLMMVIITILVVVHYYWTWGSEPRIQTIRQHRPRPRAMPLPWQPIMDMIMDLEDLEDLELGLGDRADMVFDIIEGGLVMVDDGGGGQVDVHDHRIQTSLRDSLTKLTEWYESLPKPRLSKEQVLSDIKKHIFCSGANSSLETLEKAYSTLQYIVKSNGKLEAVNLTEGEILQMIWQRICDPVNSTVKKELIDNLVELLADSTIRIGTPYCLVGRVTRMVQSLQAIDKEGIISINTTDSIAKEIQYKIPLLVDEFFKINPQLKDRYNNGNKEAAEQLMDYTREKLKSTLPNCVDASKLIDEYVDALD